MKCERCGKELSDIDLYCSRCGKAVFPQYMDDEDVWAFYKSDAELQKILEEEGELPNGRESARQEGSPLDSQENTQENIQENSLDDSQVSYQEYGQELSQENNQGDVQENSLENTPESTLEENQASAGFEEAEGQRPIDEEVDEGQESQEGQMPYEPSYEPEAGGEGQEDSPQPEDAEEDMIPREPDAEEVPQEPGTEERDWTEAKGLREDEIGETREIPVTKSDSEENPALEVRDAMGEDRDEDQDEEDSDDEDEEEEEEEIILSPQQKRARKYTALLATVFLLLCLAVGVFLGIRHMKDMDRMEKEYYENLEKQQDSKKASPAEEGYSLKLTEETDISQYQKITPTGAEADSQKESGEEGYGAEKAIDGDQTTSWQEGEEGTGEGKNIKINLDGAHAVRCLVLNLGNWRSDELWKYNTRPKTLTIQIGEQFQKNVEFTDEKTSFCLVLEEPAEASFVSLTIQESYPGERWEDNCISEVEIYE